jgi:hypothetical protein
MQGDNFTKAIGCRSWFGLSAADIITELAAH